MADVLAFNTEKKRKDSFMGIVLSKAEKEFLEKLRAGDISGYNDNYRRQLKFKILKKRKGLTTDLLLINEVLDQLEKL